MDEDSQCSQENTAMIVGLSVTVGVVVVGSIIAGGVLAASNPSAAAAARGGNYENIHSNEGMNREKM